MLRRHSDVPTTLLRAALAGVKMNARLADLRHGDLRQQQTSRTKNYKAICSEPPNSSISGIGDADCARDLPKRGDTTMFRKTKVALAAAIVLSATLSASAATKYRRVAHVDPPLYDVIPGATCSPVHPPLCSNICTGPGPCAPPDSW
jgi:hypothetical protein